ncbi:MAG: beta-ribofuranosylaminobenzene 5'-phosphate synthase family protein [Vicinamibacterales bacterium]
MNGESGRLDGSVGVALDAPALEVTVGRRARPRGARHRLPADIGDELKSAQDRLGLGHVPLDIDVASNIPRHSGLGSGTQWRLAWVSALDRLCNLGLGPAACAACSGRGGTSGIGIHAFRHGGLLVDGGHRRGRDKPVFAPSAFTQGVSPPPLLARHLFPDEWRIALYMPSSLCGLSGGDERRFMAENTPLPKAECAAVSHILLMGLLPALIERDFAAFTHAVGELQVVGWKRRHWIRPQLAPMLAVRRAFAQAEIAGCGLSSTGPTVFGFVDAGSNDLTVVRARVLRNVARDPDVPAGEFLLTKANNTGAEIDLLQHTETKVSR